jgi:hypothetical protein
VGLTAILLPLGGAAAAQRRAVAARVGAAHVRRGGSDHRSTATLDVVGGATSVVVSAGAPSGLLYRVGTPAGSGIRPLVTLEAGTLQVSQTSDGTPRGISKIDIGLARNVRWTIDLDGGATTESVDMARGSLRSLTFSAGVTRASVQLSAPVGTFTLTLTGGASQLLVVAPPGAPAQVDAAGGASTVKLDGAVHVGVAGGSIFTDPGWATSHNRYTIDLTAGVSDFEMSRR